MSENDDALYQAFMQRSRSEWGIFRDLIWERYYEDVQTAGEILDSVMEAARILEIWDTERRARDQSETDTP